MGQKQLIETLTLINKQSVELLLRMKENLATPTELYVTEVEQLQARIYQAIEQMKNTTNEYETRLAKRFYEQQEKERKNISDTLYNHFGQTLFSFTLGLELLEKYNIDPMHKDHLRDMKDQAYNAAVQIRDLANKLHPLTISDLGLFSAIRSLLYTLKEQHQAKIDFAIKEDNTPLMPITALFIYRILESIMCYVLDNKYATHMKLQITLKNKILGMRLQLQNTGDKGRIEFDKNLDYFEIIQRVEILGGTISFEPEYTITKIEVIVPILTTA